MDRTVQRAIIVIVVAVVLILFQYFQPREQSEPVSWHEDSIPLVAQSPQATYTPPVNTAPLPGAIETAFRNRTSDIPVSGTATVFKVLPDDNDGSRHQRFLVHLPSGHSLLIAHNIDIAPRLNSLREGDQVTFFGQYAWNDKGGVVHWTHYDPQGRYSGGYLVHNGMTYK